MRAVLPIKAGEDSYQILEDGDNLWGGYSSTSLDPNDDMSIWTVQEYARRKTSSTPAGNWGTWIAQLIGPAPTLNPVSARGGPGQIGGILVLTGTGFYDPGPEFLERLTVQLVGGQPNQVHDLRVEFRSPTEVLVFIDLPADTPLGPRDIVLRNPDGQFVVLRGAFHVVNPLDRFVNQAYLDLLGRSADPSGLAAWVNFLNTGGTRLAFSRALIGTGEFRAQIARELYQRLLRRSADPAGQNAIAQFLAGGGTIRQASAFLVASDEYFQTRGGGTASGWVAAVYLDLLGRSPTQAEVNALLPAVQQPGGRVKVATDLANSQEGLRHLVGQFYQTYLRRPVDSGGLTLWVNFLNGGGRENELIALLIASEEYFRFANR